MTQDSIHKAARQPDTLLSIEKREKEKLNKYGDLAVASDSDTVPAVVDYWGAWGEHIRRFVILKYAKLVQPNLVLRFQCLKSTGHREFRWLYSVMSLMY